MAEKNRNFFCEYEDEPEQINAYDRYLQYEATDIYPGSIFYPTNSFHPEELLISPPVTTTAASRLETCGTRTAMPEENGGQDKDISMKRKIAVWNSRLDDLILGMTKTDENFINNVCRPLCPPVDTGGSSGYLLPNDNQQLLSSSATSSSSSSPTISPTLSMDSLSCLTNGSEYGLPSAVADCEQVRTEYLNSYSQFNNFNGRTPTNSTLEIADGASLIERNAKIIEELKRSLEDRDEMPSVDFCKGICCSDAMTAHDILTTKYKLNDIHIRKSVISWSKWNISQIIRGPHEMSPIWNPEMKIKFDRPGSIVVTALNEDIERRDRALQRLADYQTEYYYHQQPPNLVSPPSPIEIHTLRRPAPSPPSPSTRATIESRFPRSLAPSESPGCHSHCSSSSVQAPPDKAAYSGSGNLFHRLFQSFWNRVAGNDERK